MVLAVAMTAVIIALPFVLLTPVIERLFAPAQLRAMVRRLFRIDPQATITDLPDRMADSGRAS
jgi:hypothetical protein